MYLTFLCHSSSLFISRITGKYICMYFLLLQILKLSLSADLCDRSKETLKLAHRAKNNSSPPSLFFLVGHIWDTLRHIKYIKSLTKAIVKLNHSNNLIPCTCDTFCIYSVVNITMQTKQSDRHLNIALFKQPMQFLSHSHNPLLHFFLTTF